MTEDGLKLQYIGSNLRDSSISYKYQMIKLIVVYSQYKYTKNTGCVVYQIPTQNLPESTVRV